MLIGVACKSQQSVPLIASQMALQKRLYTLSQKKMLRKGGNLNEGLMEYRNTPISNFPYSPNQMLFSRQVRTQVPVHPIMLVPQVCKDVHLLLERRQAKYKEFYDRGAKQLPPLKEEDSVRFRKPGDKHLAPAVVKGEHEAPRSYVITDETGKEYRRNRRQIHLTQEPPTTLSAYLNDVSDSVTDQCDVNMPSTESHAELELTTTDNNQSPGLRRSTRAKCIPGWHKDYIMY